MTSRGRSSEVVGSGRVDFTEFTKERKEVEPGDYYADISKIKQATGWTPQTSLEEGIRRTADYYRSTEGVLGLMVKIFDLQREYEELKGPLAEIFDRVCRSGEFITGRELAAFEEAFARYLGVHFAVGVGSGTDALRIGGLALGLKAGDKVVTTPNTYVATVMALSVHGIVPFSAI